MSTERAWRGPGESVVSGYESTQALPSVRMDRAARIGDGAKRAFDVCAVLLGLLLASPVLLALAIVIKLDSAGPVFYSDMRLGKRGRRFRCHKFRTMHTNGDEILQRYLAGNPAARAEWDTYKKLRAYDPRVSRLGKLLRKLSLDELPQLWNVLIGDMSLVGPRPYLVREHEDMGIWREEILLVRPGITGLWQVGGRSELSFRQRLRLEAWYVRHRSLLFDLQLLVKTVVVVIARRGAY